MRRFIRFAWILMPLAFAGCEPNELVGHAGPFLVSDAANRQEKQVAAIHTAAVYPAIGWNEFYLVDNVPATSDQAAIDKIVASSSPWVKVDGKPMDIVDVVAFVTQDCPKEQIRWLISVHPLVVALGGAVHPRGWPGLVPADSGFIPLMARFNGDENASLWLVTKDDLTQKVSTVVVIDPFPSNREDGMAARRAYPLSAGTSLEEVFDRKHWEAGDEK